MARVDISLDFRTVASSPMVIVGGEATMLLKNPGTGNLLVFPLFMPYEGTEADFRIDYYNKLVELGVQKKLKPMLFYSYINDDGTQEEILCGTEMYEILNASCDLHERTISRMEKAEKYPKIIRPFFSMERATAIFCFLWIITLFVLWAVVLFNHYE